MNSIVKAKIKWLSVEEGGRPKPPLGPTYSTVACFEDIKDKWPDEAWSLVTEFHGLPDKSGYIVVNLRFLVEENAPLYLLYPGSRFKLFEGHKLVALGEILK